MPSMLRFFLQAYEASDLVIKTRARNLFWVLAPFLTVLTLLGTLTLFTTEPLIAVIAFLLAGGFGVGLALLAQGRYRRAANLTFGLLVLGAAAASLATRTGSVEDDVIRIMAFFSLGLTLTSFFGYTSVQGILMAVAGLVTMGATFLVPFPADALTLTIAQVNSKANPLAFILLFLVSGAVGALTLAQNGRILAQSRRAQEVTEEGFSDVQKVFAETQEGLAVSRQMGETAQDLQKGARAIREELAILEAQTANLAVQAREAGQSSGVLGDIQTSLRDKMEAQVRSIHQTSSALEQINALFQTIATSSRTKKESLDELGTQAREGEKKVVQMAGAFAAMQRTAEEVLSVVQVIEDISARTNLLAMNASIEAAHAGSSGRGFSVVAAEIRKLAEETGRNSQAIRQTLDTNLSQVQNAVQASRESQTLLATMIRAFQDIQTLLGEQMNGMNEMGQGTEEILRSVEELQTGTAIVQEAARSLEGAVLTNRHQATSVQEAVQVLTDGVGTLQSVAETIGQSAQTIEEFGERNHRQVQGLRQSLEKVSADMAERKGNLA